MVALRMVPIGILTDMRKRAIKRNVYKIIHKTPQGRGNTHIESDLLRQGVHIWDGVLGSMSLCLIFAGCSSTIGYFKTET